ncbi:MAG: MoxR family ATPase, partial [Candidatus Heimdallarchaeota archaeon]|nr:MoxR family ATPase [Candidatus Heimdallarchaeota archaeon]
THALPKAFFLMATQNPIEQVGVYPLPEAQLDRFMIRLIMKLPNFDQEFEILISKRAEFIPSVSSVTTSAEIISAQEEIEKIEISDEVLHYIARLVVGTRFLPALSLGGSPRASLALMSMGRAWAGLNGRAYVEPDDIKKLYYYVMNHRLILTPQAEVEQVPIEQVIRNVLNNTPVKV